MYVLKSYFGGEPRQSFGVIENEHSRLDGHYLVEDIMKEFFDE